MSVLVFIEERSGAPTEDALGVLSKAASLDVPVTAVACGGSAELFAPSLGNYGARRVIVLQHRSFAEPLYTLRVDALELICRRDSIDLLLCPTTALSCDVAAGLATRLEAGVCWGLVDIELKDGQFIGKRLAENDALVAEIEWSSVVKIGLFRPHAIEPIKVNHGDPQVELLTLDLAPRPAALRVIETKPSVAADGPSLGTAEIVVSGGRGLERPENLELIRELASALDGVAGVSLPVVEMGWAPRSMQVGQTGAVVKPRLYVACGISGQMQHRVGMENSGTIVAINRDASAPIMGFCDLAVVADLQNVLPRLIALLRRRGEAHGSQQTRVVMG
ncbi:MAG TPA: electron transfer flavoprotein subunit alpha/FixB family protein [Xanthobacteraceae bacterium]|nr:electron transfer flavoprotein subunit alpha/FixB family protein [Xanthobacteraceae bacterium]